MSYTVADPIYYNKPIFKFRRPMATKKNLFENFDEEDSMCPSEDAIKVFLRLKPTSSESDVIQVLDSKTLLFKMPQEFMQARNKLNMPDQYKYLFSHIYQSNTSQSQLYTGCVAPLIKDLFNGHNCLLFTYGTTNAGKTFTVLGNGDNPGIIPRTLTTVFKSISGKEYNNDQIMPDKFNSAIELTENTLSEERKFKDVILTWNHNKSHPDSKLYKTQSTVRSSVDEIFGESVFREMQKRLTNDTSIVECASDGDDRFSVWVSFAEIYNEAIYDLLQPVVPNTKRKQLKLGQDNHKNYYIKGLKNIFVRSEEEAYKVLMFGKNNLQVAATGMNSRSSRSHCIFTIKLIKSPNVEHPERVVVSSFSICDLAGAERQKKTLNVGLRLKESQNINCSLHVLSRCFTIIRENQVSMEPKMIPFRDSKLTQLFRHALTGKESVTMIVNVNSDHQLCEETQHVLKASAIAKHIVVQPRKAKMFKRDTRQSLFSQIIVKHNRSTLIPWDSCVKPKALETACEEVVEPIKNGLEQNQEQYENLLSVIEELKDKLKEEKAKHFETKKNWKFREEEIRKEMKEELTHFLEQAKQENELDSKRTENARQVVDKTKKRRLLSPEERPAVEKQKTTCHEGLDQSLELKDLQEEVKLQQKQIDGLTDLVNILRDEKKELRMDLTLAQLNLSHRERDISNLKAKIEMFGEESSLHEKYLALEKDMEGKILVRDQLLNEAREDLLAEMRAKDDLEDEIAKLEKELTEKDECLLTQMEEMKQEISDKEDQIDLLEARIENMEYVHEEELKVLKVKCTTLEEELMRLSHLEEKGLSDSSVLNIEKEKTKLTTEVEQLRCEKSSIEKQLSKQLEEYNSFKEEISERLNSLVKMHEEEISKTIEDFRQKLESRDKEIRQLNDKIKYELECLESIKEELNNKATEAESYKLGLEEKEKAHDSVKNDLENRIIELTQRLDEETKSSTVTQELKSKCQLLQEALEKKSEEIELLQKTAESLTKDRKKTEEECRSEISMLEESCKEQLRETTRLWESQRAQERDKEKLKRELSKVKNIVADLNRSLKTKEHELECCRSQMMGYEKMVPTLQTEFEVQRNELLEYKKRCEDQKETIINMEKELDSFQVHQKEIIGKYEDSLKKSKEENDSLKKEVARVTTTFFKSTPTPKKILENQIKEYHVQVEDLKMQLEEKEANCDKLLKENEILCTKFQEMQTLITEGPNKENDSVFNATYNSKGTKSRTKTAVDFDIRRRAQSCEEDHYSSSDVDNNKKAKSASKAKTRRMTRAAAKIPTISVEEVDVSKISEKKATETKQTRKKLWDATMTNDEEQFEDDEKHLNIPEDSPGTYYRRALRNRNK